MANPDLPTHIVGIASSERRPQNIRDIEEPIDEALLAGVQEILAQIHNVAWRSGRAENT